ncbi:Hypothetical predicted protein, partial [Paramuricea clavata]
MADQDHPPKPKTPTEDDDRSEARTPVGDARALGPDFPRENIQTNADQKKKEDRNVGSSGQPEWKPTYTHSRKGEPELQKKKGNNTENSKVVTSRESQKINNKTSGTVQGENDQLGSEQIQQNRSKEETKEMKHSNPFQYGSSGQRNSVRDHTFTITEENTQKSYSQAAHTLGNTQRSNSQAADTPGNAQKSYSQAVRTQGNAQRSCSEQKPYSIPSPTSTSTKVNFYLLILGEYSVDQAFIHLGPDEIKELTLVNRRYNLWRYSATLPGDPINNGLKYKYRFIEKGHDSKFPFLSHFRMFSTDPTCFDESSDRDAKSQTQYDVFRFPQDKEYLSETVPKAIFSYLKLLLPCVNPSNISDLLNHIESFHFITLSTKHVKECVNWIVEYALDLSGSDVQRLYLCIVLGHLNYSSSSLPFPNDNKTAKACDRLLQCLNACVDSNFLSKSDLECLKKIAITLVVHSSSPGWLTLAAHSYPYLGIEFVLDKEHNKDLNYEYYGNEYKKIVAALLVNIKIENDNDRIGHQDLLYRVLRNNPTSDAAMELFKNSDVCQFFTDEGKKVNFFASFYQETMRATNTSVGAKLVGLYKIPEEVRGRMHKFLFSTLIKYAKSDEELNDEHVKIFLKSVISEKYLERYEVLDILVELSKSKSVPHQDLLLEILNKDMFKEDWHKAPLPRKVDICKLWVITKTINKKCLSSISGVDKIVAVYEAVDAIMQCSLNFGNRILVQDVCKCIMETILRDEDAVSVLKAFTSIEKCAAVVQDCYISHVRMRLRQASKAVKKSSMFLKECSNS